jgi:sigma54-dependent transcription regulator
MLRVLDLVAQVAPRSRSTVLITGETGTGKELIAKAIHANSPRAEQPFVGVNSGSVAPDLLESALFGHVKGAFTGAMANRKGYFETADRAPFSSTRSARSARDPGEAAARDAGARVHARRLDDIVRVDVRILAATNADLKKLVEDGKFREDLYYRLNVINIALPPLRDRKEDIPALMDHFFTKYLLPGEREVPDAEGRRAALRAGGAADPDGLQLAGQRPGTGERGERAWCWRRRKRCRHRCCRNRCCIRRGPDSAGTGRAIAGGRLAVRGGGGF